ncbi:MAG: AAA family ATPase [Cystobacterineae bacterium]|nr:AAA family ATPase [Cystobacterineae bacterium]
MVYSSDFAQVLTEAEDIARSVRQPLTTAHILFAMFTVENRAALLLKEKGIDEDALLELLKQAPQEQEGLVRELKEKAREIANGCGCNETDTLHALIAATRIRCLAQDLLFKTGLDLTGLRNKALSYYLSGRMPRRLLLTRELGHTPVSPPKADFPRPLGAPPRAQTPLIHPRETKTGEHPLPLSMRELFETTPQPTPPAPPTTPSPSASPPKPPPQAMPSLKTLAAPHAKKEGAFSLSMQYFPLLCGLGKNLTALAKEGKLDPVIGRAKEIDEVIDVLGKRRTNNPCLVGEPGVGKTAIAEGVAQQLLRLTGPLSSRVLIQVDVASLVAGTQLRGSFSERLNALKDEVKRAQGHVIVFVDEIHMLIGAGASGDGPQDAANELKTALAHGEFPCIGATTHDEYRQHIAQDSALERRFTRVWVNEPSAQDALYIINGLIHRYEEHHHVRFLPETLKAAVSLSAKYIQDRCLPDKAISLLDLSGSRCRRAGKEVVEPDDIARVVAQLVSLPEERLLMEETARLLNLETELKAQIIGHEDSIARMASVIRRNYAGFASRRPMGSFLLLGPTGVGKTEFARVLAQVLFGNANALIQLDMSESSESHGISRLIGAPAGYVGYGDGGQLTEPVRKRPSSVVVLDEIEKAHRDVLMLLLQILEEGRLTDGKGRHVDFSNTVVLMTSNLGAEAFIPKTRSLGFGASSPPSPASPHEEVLKKTKEALPLELWNRIDERCVFSPLSHAQIIQIAGLLLKKSSERLLQERGISFEVGEEVVEYLLANGGFDPSLGARPMRQTIQRLIEGPLAEHILAGHFQNGDFIRLHMREGQLEFC